MLAVAGTLVHIKLLIELSLVDVGENLIILLFLFHKLRLYHVVSKPRRRILVAHSFVMNAVSTSDDWHSADDDEHSVLGVHSYSNQLRRWQNKFYSKPKPLAPFHLI